MLLPLSVSVSVTGIQWVLNNIQQFSASATWQYSEVCNVNADFIRCSISSSHNAPKAPPNVSETKKVKQQQLGFARQQPVATLHQGAPGQMTWLEDPPPWPSPWPCPAYCFALLR